MTRMMGSNNQTNQIDSRNASTNTLSRRDFLVAFGGGPLAITALSSRAASESLEAGDLLLSSDTIPDQFTSVKNTNEVPFFEYLRAADPILADSDLAANGFWAGHDQDNPHWVLASAACVADRQVPVQAALKATTQAHNDFIQEYDTETPHWWNFERHHYSRTDYHEWRANIYFTDSDRGKPALTNQATPAYIDTIRMHHQGAVLLWSVLFGPTNGRWRYEELLKTAVNHQRIPFEV